MNKFQIIKTAFESRLLFSTEEEWHDLLGVYFATISSKRHDTQAIDNYYAILDAACTRLAGCSLEAAVISYLYASELYLTLDWGDRSQARSRKNFARKLFFIASTQGQRMSFDEEDAKFKSKDADLHLIKAFFPEGTEAKPTVEIVFIILFCFGILRPWNPEGQRYNDIQPAKTLENLRKLSSLLLQLKEDLPPEGTLGNPVVFDQWISIFSERMQSEEAGRGCSPLWMAYALEDVKNGILSTLDPQYGKKVTESMISLNMPGIWIDDSGVDERFWVFPANLQLAFCYQKNKNDWELLPYEFICYPPDTDKDFANSCYFFSPKGNSQLFLNPGQTVAPKELAHAGYRMDLIEDEVICRITFHKVMGDLPEWMDWREFRRLNRGDRKYKEYYAVLERLYDYNPLSKFLLNNHGEFFTDSLNNIVGQDKRYMYVADYRRPDRFLLTKSDESPDHFLYLPYYSSGEPDLSLIGMEISEAHPLYAIPTGGQKKNFDSPDLQLLAKIMEDPENLMSVSIIHRGHTNPSLLFFQGLAKAIPLDMKILKEFGVKKITSRFI